MEWLFIVTILCAAIRPTFAQANEYNGRDFLLLFMPNTVEMRIPDGDTLSIIVSNPDSSQTANVSMITREGIFDDTVAIGPRSSHIFTLPYATLHEYPGIDKKGVAVRSLNNIPITVTGVNALKFSTDSFLVLPITSLGIGYTAACTRSTLNTQIGIVAVFDSTLVKIALPPNPSSEDQFPLDIEHDGVFYSYNDRLEVRLDAGYSFLLSARGDLTGTTIKSSKRIAVFSGNVRTKYNGTTRDHLVEQMIPYYSWSNTYLSAYVHSPSRGSEFRVLARESVTTVTLQLTGAKNETRKFLLTHPAQFVEVDVNEDVDAVFTSRHDKPIYVYKVMKSIQTKRGSAAANLADRLGDPSLNSLSSPRYWRDFYIFRFPVKLDGTEFDNYITIFTIGTPMHALLDGNRVDVQFRNMANGYHRAVIFAGNNSSGFTHTLSLVDQSKIGVVLTGYADRETYSHALGFDLMQSPGCLMGRAVVPGDGLDNDCDASIDEEEINGVDDDDDMLIDEDTKPERPAVSSGRGYYIMFMENTVERVNNVPLEVFIGAMEKIIPTVIRVTYPVSGDGTRTAFRFYMFPQEVYKLEFNYTLMQRGTGLDKKAIHVVSSEDIVLYALNKEQFSADGFLALPIATLGKTYYTVSFWPPTLKTQFAIVVTKTGTNLTITFPPVTHDNERIEVYWKGTTYSNDQSFSMVNLERFDTFQIQDDGQGDLSGTYIEATESIAVFSGNVRTAVDGTSRDHLVEQLPPLVSLGKTFATMNTPKRTVGDHYKIIAAQANTTIQYCQRTVFEHDLENSSCSTKLISSAGSHMEIQVASSGVFMYINASKPVMVFQISASQTAVPISRETEHADPSMIYIPPIEQYGANYTFLTPSASTEEVGAYRYHFLMVIIHANETDGLMVDRNRTIFSNVEWQQIPESNLLAGYIQLSFALHTLTHVDPTVTYMALLYGVADRESYGYPAGLKLNDLSVCKRSTQIVGDGIDNDCDGKTDEEYCLDDVDNDLDGEMDEDCTSIPGNFTYVVGYMENIVEYPHNFPLRLYGASRHSQHVRVYTPAYRDRGETYDHLEFVNASMVVNLGFRPDLRHYGSSVDAKAIVVQTEYPMRFYGSNKERFSHDSFRVLEKKEAGTDYVVMTYNPPNIAEEFIIVPFENNTVISITLSSSLSKPIQFMGNSYSAGSRISDLILNEGYTAQIQSNSSTLGGTEIKVVNNRPVAVYSGNVRTMVGSSKSRDHLVGTMLPVDSWNTTYYLPTTPDRTVNDLVLLVCYRPNVIEVLSNNGTTVTYNMVDYVQRIIEVPTMGRAYMFTAHYPFQMARITSSQRSSHELADPSLMMIMPFPQSSYYFVPPTYSGGSTGGRYKNVIQILIQSGAVETEQIIINGKPQEARWTPIHDTGFVFANFNVDNEQRPNIISHTRSFFAYAYGSADRESYAMPL